jgi:hypothetical protein
MMTKNEPINPVRLMKKQKQQVLKGREGVTKGVMRIYSLSHPKANLTFKW